MRLHGAERYCVRRGGRRGSLCCRARRQGVRSPRLRRGKRVSTPKHRDRPLSHHPFRMPGHASSEPRPMARLRARFSPPARTLVAAWLCCGRLVHRARLRRAAADAPEHHRPAHRRPGEPLAEGDEDRQQGDEAKGGDVQALLHELPALLPVADDDAHRRVRPQPRRAVEHGRPTAATASSTSCHGNDYLPIWLQRAGYTTSYIGKFLNGYAEPDEYGTLPRDVPAGWNDWHVLAPSKAEYFNYTLNENGAPQQLRRQ